MQQTMLLRGVLLTAILVVIAVPACARQGAGVSQAPAQAPVCSSCHAEVVRTVATSSHVNLGCETCHPQHETVPHPGGIAKPECGQCHEEIAAKHAASVHGRALAAGNAAAPNCPACHGGAHQAKATNSPDFRKGVPDICGQCHDGVAREFKASVHGDALARGVREAPVCTSCHGEHRILAPTSPASPVNPLHIRETCAQCHGNVRLSEKFGLPADRIVSFDASYHGLAAAAGSQSVANCATCHGVHNILPSSDPRSMINPKNLAATCGKCHPGAGQRFALGRIHVVAGAEESEWVHWARVVYLVLIPVAIGLMFIHNLGDWVRKVWRLRVRARIGEPQLAAGPPAATFETQLAEIRMLRGERVLHLLLLISFAVLVWTGFALKYPHAFWARPLVAFERYFPVRGTVHRLAGLIMIAVALAHGLSLAVSGRLRNHWKTLFPKRRDVTEGVLNLAYNLGLRRRRPPLSTHSYVEKAEYWAVVWGTAVMALTGAIMWANKFTLAHWPKAVLDFCTTVHFYEAVLATLSIVVWHFYSVIFDPDVYPMDTAWFRGTSVKRRPSAEEDPPQRH